ncbi:hypothetical protein LTR36_009645 [Oleoguttula mirabilis]|uniref:Nuclear pore protein n=1 Tax=Oleoguttula mirabilis TaxID=1507867 RepID=A0AAV9J5I1_9PEZI|nr:hypothetical protein LTR36_009645 [Oleoguttula mirabilis]
MARYPTFEEYETKGNFNDGVKRCDELLQKSTDDIQLLTTKFRLLSASSEETHADHANAVLEKLTTLSPPLQDPSNVAAIEDAAVAAQKNVYPPVPTAGPLVAKLWDQAIKATGSMSRKLDIISERWERAVYDSRVVDMQQTLIQLKAIQPKNRAVYMAHAALTQMISTSNEDFQARLALGLARKAVTERFDDDKSLDCRVPGQIFALQRSEKDLESIRERSFKESKQVFDALRERSGIDNGGAAEAPIVRGPLDVPSNEWLSAEITSLQAEFSRLIGISASPDLVQAFTQNAIRLFHAASNSLGLGARRSPADACFLAISALVRLHEQTDDTQYLLHAAFLAETLLRHNEHIHEARLILVYLYMRLGLGSLAMRLFDSLSVKEIQFDTLGHVLFTRLSLLHPQATVLKGKETFDPFKRTAHALAFYARCEDKLAETEASVLGHGQTGMIFELQELRDSLRTSLSRRITSLEWRRIARLMKNKCEFNDARNQMGPQVIANWTEVKENRDFDAAFDYGFNVERALHGREGSMPGKAWIVFSLIADTAWSAATGDPPMVLDFDGVWDVVVDKVKSGVDLQASASAQASSLGLTAAEYLAGDLAYRTLRILVSIHNINEENMQELIAATGLAMERLNIDSLIAAIDPLTERLLDHYAYADALRIVIVACTSAMKRTQLSTQLKQLQDRAKRLFLTLQRHATEQQARIKAPKVRQQMARDDGIWQALQAFGGSELDGFCSEVAKSAKEGWEGVARIKLV